MKQFYVYLLASRRNGTLYIGVTSDVVARVWQHKTKALGGFTARYGCDSSATIRTGGTSTPILRVDRAPAIDAVNRPPPFTTEGEGNAQV